ncbi:sulfotransferase family protein [Roseicyclus marinus]|uniref:sulfotransferase family 2 domain-containing protein n=1 Tax=Roseicyclus marinus TaxID=2161673 RepID=UPI00241010D0|nr:sulfotransferase family 2 domain-containing protein [Roseicyclus marinus]MDG3040952.1 sulfotransferase family 2 domain-containing protein [Roseicyclus marinus]
MTERTIILHYHLFKNAGTSVDAILKRNFPGKWVTREFPAMGGNNTPLVEAWIRETPEAIAYSSHTMMGPIPQIDGVRVISFLLLRDPIERIKSAYRFERTQTADTWGARLAKEHDFEGYVRARLARPGDRQCRNFQTYRLASLMPGEGTELDRAKRALKALSVVGRVEAFDVAMRRLAAAYPGFSHQAVKANTSAGKDEVEMTEKTLTTLQEMNKLDVAIISSIEQKL